MSSRPYEPFRHRHSVEHDLEEMGGGAARPEAERDAAPHPAVRPLRRSIPFRYSKETRNRTRACMACAVFVVMMLAGSAALRAAAVGKMFSGGESVVAVPLSRATPTHVLELVRALVSRPSPTSSPFHCERALQFISKYFAPTDYVLTPYSHWADAPSLLVSSKQPLPLSAGAPLHFAVLVLAHVDTVACERSAMQVTGFESERLYGCGIADMKGPLAAVMAAMAAIDPASANIALFVSTDEERGGMYGSRWALLDPTGPRLSADVVVVPDAGPAGFQIVTHEKGILHAQITAKGNTGHASRPWEGHNAAERLMSDIRSLMSLPLPGSEEKMCWDGGEEHWHTTCTVTGLWSGVDSECDLRTVEQLHACISVNQVPSTAHAFLDLRFIEPWDSGSVERHVRKALAHSDLNVIRTGEMMLAHPAGAARSFIEEAAAVIERVIGRSAKYARGHGASDGRFASEAGLPVVMFNPDGGESHGDGEWVSFPSLVQFHDVVLELFKEWAVTVSL